MAMNLCCFNSRCKFYFEDLCDKNLNEELMFLDENGRCTTFKEGIHEGYLIDDDR